MTSPLKNKEQQRANWLIRYVGVQKAYDKKVIKALKLAADDALEAADKWDRMNIGDRTKRYQFDLVAREIRGVIADLFKGLVPVLAQGQMDAAEAAAKALLEEDAKVLEALFPSKNMRESWEESFTASARHTIGAMVNRVAGIAPTYNLSRRVYKSGALSSNQLQRQINSSLARGSSAKELADLVRKSILPNTPGGVSYAAMRLGRTEINNAFHTQSIVSMKDEPWVEHVQWNLSGVHKPDPGDLCETYAAQGTFDKYDVPLKPHPQCMCYVTPVMVQFDSFASNLAAGVYDSYYQKEYNAA